MGAVPAGLLHHLGAVVAAHLAEGLVAVHDGVVHYLRVRQEETTVCCWKITATVPHDTRLLVDIPHYNRNVNLLRC